MSNYYYKYTNTAEECLYCGENRILIIFNASEQCCQECNEKFNKENKK